MQGDKKMNNPTNTTAKILFTDLDGTLLNDQKEITPENYVCIQDWIHAGNICVICTGRSISSAIRQAKKLNLTMKGCLIVAFNGAMILDIYHNQILYQAQIPMDYVRELFAFAKAHQLHIQAYDDQYFYCQEEDAAAVRYGTLTNMEYRIDPSLPDSLTACPCKLLLIDYENKQPLLRFEEEIKDWAKGKVDMFFSCDQYLEIVPPGVNKGTAVKQLCAYLGIPVENSISAGDAENDIAMLKVTGESIVMKNADPSMYAYATVVTTYDNNHSGIADTLRSFFL